MKRELKDLNEIALVENLKKNIGGGLIPSVNPINDIFFKEEYAVNSWFAIGHFETSGEKLNYLFHLMIMNRPNQLPVINSNLSITNETTGWYYADDKIYPLEIAEIKETGEGEEKTFSIKVPNGHLSGNLDEMYLEAQMPHGEIKCKLKSYGSILLNGGSGNFPTMIGENFNQYSIPNLFTTGSIRLDDKIYNIEGKTWFDRQWQNEGSNFGARWNWSWMDINLDNGDTISLWDMRDITNKKNYAWATVLHVDGTQTVATMEPLVEKATEYWKSSKSGQNYPTKWIVTIPSLDAILEVTSVIKEQEIISEIPFLNKYEGASTVNGVYRGKNTKGYCYVELLGEWK